MRTRLVLLLLGSAGSSLLGAYQYYVTDSLVSIDPAKWVQNGSLTTTSNGLTAPSATGGSLISNLPVPDGTSEYEVRTRLRLVASGGTYVLYLRASMDALSGPAPSGTYYAFEIQNPTFNGNACSAGMSAYKRVDGIVTLLGYTTIPCRDGMVVSTVFFGWGLVIFVDNVAYWNVAEFSIPAGQPGIGAYGTPAGNAISLVELGVRDRVGPGAPNPRSFGISSFPNRVDVQWQGSVDDPNGVGLWVYTIFRDGIWYTSSMTPEFTDASVSPSTTYTYTIQALDYHYTPSAPTTITVTTPPAGSIDPTQIGVRPAGVYWGGAGEQLDMRSGNLNFSLPLLRAKGRGGRELPFVLSYNSQLWRRDSGGVWKIGKDVGYGFGWRLQAGSITPYWSNYWIIHHYVFTDSTGAEYRLDVNNNGVWSSREGTYVEYDSATNRLYFPDGSFWVMGAVSAGTEEDAGTRYPTVIQDTNGNQILVRYHAGVGVTWPDSSARINQIEDVRAWAITNDYYTYRFWYNSDPVPHLTGIGNRIGTGEHYTFSYVANATLSSPFLPQTSFGSTYFLQSVTIPGLSARG